MAEPRYPSLYQLNTRVALGALSRTLGRPASLDDLPDAELDRLRDLGFDWLWLLGVWQTGPASRRVSRSHPEWQEEFHANLPDLEESDICGSCFAVTGYQVHSELGGNAALERLRVRIHQRGLRLMLDFVPNHTALDHDWLRDHPDYFIRGTDEDRAREPHNYTQVQSRDGLLVVAHGRDPYFPGWPDTLQLDYGNPDLQAAMQRELLAVAALCDGVRCDMAMLIEPEVFERTWGVRPKPFWPDAIGQVRAHQPGFTFMAEVYWDMEWALQQQGFDYTYDKRLYDRLRDRQTRPVREHLAAGLDFQDRLARFLENHDEPRAATSFAPGVHEAAALITYLSPGLRFFHQGQLEGRRARISPHLCRGPDEAVDEELQAFYRRLLEWLEHPVFRAGEWRLLDCLPGAEGDPSSGGFVASAWQGKGGTHLLVAVNYSDQGGQCRIRVPFEGLGNGRVRSRDWVSGTSDDRDRDELREPGMCVELDPWAFAILELQPVAEASSRFPRRQG